LKLSSAPISEHGNDGLILYGVRITNAVKCLPPQNKPKISEIVECNHYLQQEIAALPDDCNILALGKIAHDAVLRSFQLKLSGLQFIHGATHVLPDNRRLTDSYHCSRYNTQTRRLTPEMFLDVMKYAVL